MTDARALRRRVAALAMIPATAGIFGASVAWASWHDPLAKSASSTTAPVQPPAAAGNDQAAATDQRLIDLTAQVAAAETRIAELQGSLMTQAAVAPAPAAAPAAPAVPRSVPAPAAALAPAAAPPVHVVTKASP